jgi:hypothetical protein
MPALLSRSCAAGDAGATFRLAHLAATDAAAAGAEDVPRRAAVSAAVLVEAFSPVLTPDVRAAAVTAVFGRPGVWGTGVPVQLARDAGRWTVTAIGSAHPVLLPPLPDPVVRSIPGEEAAVRVARRFLDLANAGDRDRAWELVSAAAKAELSRRRFEEDLGAVVGAGEQPPRREWFRQ